MSNTSKRLAVIWAMALVLLMNNAFYAQDNLQQVQKKLEEISQILNKATLEGDYETLLSCHTDDAIIKPDFSPAIKGKRALREQYEKNKREGGKIHSFSATTEDMWIRGDEIYERGTFGMAASSKGSPKPVAVYGSYFQIWLKQADGSYKIKYLIWNLDFDPYKAN